MLPPTQWLRPLTDIPKVSSSNPTNDKKQKRDICVPSLLDYFYMILVMTQSGQNLSELKNRSCGTSNKFKLICALSQYLP